MSREELIGTWTLKRKDASGRYQQARSELALIGELLEKLGRALRLEDLTAVEAMVSTTHVAGSDEIKKLLADLNVSKTQMEHAATELSRLLSDE